MSTNVSYFFNSACFSKRVQNYTFIFNRQEIFEVFFKKILFSFSSPFPTNLSMNLHVLRGAKVSSVFKSHKLFLNYFLICFCKTLKS